MIICSQRRSNIDKQDNGLIPGVTSVHMYNQCLEKAEIHTFGVTPCDILYYRTSGRQTPILGRFR